MAHQILSETKTGDNFKRTKRKRKTYDEIYIPGSHTTDIAWDGYSEWEDLPHSHQLRNVPVKIRKLCHITHNQEATEIIREESYAFKVKSKHGKSGYGKYNGTPVGKSYEMYEPTTELPTINTEYKHVDSERKLLPGYYSWWSIDETSKYKPAKENNYIPSPVFIDSPQSPYGNNKFSCEIVPLLNAYQTSYPRRNGTRLLPKIVFRCGGTLRYRYEICNVVIICTEWSQFNEEKYPKIWRDIEMAYYYRNNEIHYIDPIKVIFKNGIKSFRSTCSKKDQDQKKFKYYSWDTFAFAFYFPDRNCEIKCRKSYVKLGRVGHRFCTKSQPINGDHSYTYVCPNKLPPVVRKQSVESEEEEDEDGEMIDIKHYHKRQRISSC